MHYTRKLIVITNMREIKFRAWDKDKKKMFMPSALSLDSTGVNIMEMNDYENGSWPEVRGWKGNAFFELMQYTGLKDKNGKEIYEGDIVQEKDKLMDRIYVVRYGVNVEIDASDYEEYSVPISGFYFTEIYDSGNEGENIGMSYYPVEVIGNIYENPELLKENK